MLAPSVSEPKFYLQERSADEARRIVKVMRSSPSPRQICALLYVRQIEISNHINAELQRGPADTVWGGSDEGEAPSVWEAIPSAATAPATFCGISSTVSYTEYEKPATISIVNFASFETHTDLPQTPPPPPQVEAPPNALSSVLNSEALVPTGRANKRAERIASRAKREPKFNEVNGVILPDGFTMRADGKIERPVPPPAEDSSADPASSPSAEVKARRRKKKSNYATKVGKNAPHQSGECKLFVGNLHPDVDHHILTSLFAQFGDLLEVFVLKNKVKSRTKDLCAFVRYQSYDSGLRAVNGLNGVVLNTKPINVKFACEKGDQPEPTWSPRSKAVCALPQRPLL